MPSCHYLNVQFYFYFYTDYFGFNFIHSRARALSLLLLCSPLRVYEILNNFKRLSSLPTVLIERKRSVFFCGHVIGSLKLARLWTSLKCSLEHVFTKLHSKQWLYNTCTNIVPSANQYHCKLLNIVDILFEHIIIVYCTIIISLFLSV